MVTDEAFIAETAVWPIFFLSYECFLLLKDLNVLFLFVIPVAGALSCGGRKSLSALVYSADYILLLVL